LITYNYGSALNPLNTYNYGSALNPLNLIFFRMLQYNTLIVHGNFERYTLI
jgi:hypothetical protein